MKSEKCFYAKGSKGKKPQFQCTIYVDGTAGKEFREGVDIELSHWIPNRTKKAYKAGTSTEICFKFLDAKENHPYDLVINNHLDIDGLLSAFVLCYSETARAHRDTLLGAAKTGDFWAWSEGKSLKLFQELTLLYQHLEGKKIDLQQAYEICFTSILSILQSPEIESPTQAILERQCALIEQGKIERYEISPRLTAYHVPYSLSRGRVKEFLQIPSFNEAISERIPFWPQVRNRYDEKNIQLIAIETENGIHYDLWYPGYVWADTQGLWRPPGLILSNTMGTPHQIMWPKLSQVIQELHEMETGACNWTLFPGISFSGRENPRNFPIIASTLGKHKEIKESQLDLNQVSDCFKRLF